MMTWKALGVSGGVTLVACLFSACSVGDAGGGAGGEGSSTGNNVASSAIAVSSGAGTMVSSSSASSGSGGGGPITCMAQYTNIPTGQCDLLQQDCPPGQSCRPQMMGGTFTTTCVMASGLKGAATACANTDECEAGLFCVANKCTPVCCADPGSTSCGGGTCNLDLTFTMTTYFMRVCSFLQSCMLFTPGSCPAGEQCHLTDPMQGLAECIAPSGNPVMEGATCMYVNDCGESQLCLNEMGMGVCRYNCDLTNWQTLQPGLGGCPAGRTCMNVGFMPPNVGACRP